MKLAVGIDIGGTKTNIGLVSAEGNLVSLKRIATNALNPIALTEDLLKEIKLLINNRSDIIGIGLASAGRIDFKDQKIVYTTDNLKDWSNIPIRNILMERFNLPVYIDNDVNAALFTDLSLNPSFAQKTVIFLTIGTGLGGAVAYKGNILRGTTGSVGEFGHMVLYPEGRPCNCGKKGCAEQYISGRAYKMVLEEMFKKKEIKYTDNDFDPVVIQDRIFKKDSIYYNSLIKMTLDLALLLESIKNCLDFDLCILGGSFSAYKNIIIDVLEKEFANYSNKYSQKPEFIFSKANNNAGVIGGGLLIFKLLS